MVSNTVPNGVSQPFHPAIDASSKINKEHEDRKELLRMEQQHQMELLLTTFKAFNSAAGKLIEAYTAVQAAKLNDRKARYDFILALAQVDKELAKTFIMNDGAEIAGEAGREGAKELMGELARSLSDRY